MSNTQRGSLLRQTRCALQTSSPCKAYLPVRTRQHCRLLRLGPGPGRRVTISKAYNDSQSDVDSSNEEIPMRELENPASSSRNTSLDSSDSPPPEDEQRKGLLQRIAFTFVSFLTALIPQKFRSAWSSDFKPRMLRIAIFFLIGSLMSVASATSRRGVVAPPQEVMYSDFLNMVNSNNVRAARFEEGTGRILFDIKAHSTQLAAEAAAEEALLASPVTPSTSGSATSINSEASAARIQRRNRYYVPRQFYTRHIADPQLISTLNAAGVEFGAVRASAMSGIVRVIATALALWLPLIPVFIIMRRFIEGRNGGSNRKAKKNKKDDMQRVTFADVAGVGPAKAELVEVVACLKDARRFARVGAKLPSGVLLCGPPGNGKTLLAKAVAGEAGVPFIAASASEFVELFVGRGAARVRELFAEARKVAPCVVFIDELDAVGGRRGAGLNEERDQTLNQLLTELDGFEGRQGVMLLAATNRPEVLDPALMRPGRLSRKVNVPLPDESGRAQILAVHMRSVPISGGNETREMAATAIARLTAGFNGAELANVINEAAFMAARREGDSIELSDLVEAVQRTRFGVNGGGSGGPTTGLGKWLQGLVVDLASSKNGVRTQPLGS